MGQSMNKLTGGDERKAKEISPIIDECYNDIFGDPAAKDKEITSTDFYRAVCQTVEEINKRLGYTQLRVPSTETLKKAFEDHHQNKGKSLTKEEFGKIIQDIVLFTGFGGTGAKDILLYIFGVPMAALFIKQRMMPTISNDVFIPGVTSATVFVLAKLNKI
ncbi:hypothetical protein HHK36_017882 [Tetracentron sinense]|uniref:EF-hand domain-containing protein n=1 Tax=Tetracentron sinense TaxID=13715 RepID=A0A834YXX9_TETSI|nr:hypothetical protein HHK36_017882 [Tetracentron sinense]